MMDYKKLLYESQAVIADTVDKLEVLTDELKKCMQKCEEEILSEENKISVTYNKNDS